MSEKEAVAPTVQPPLERSFGPRRRKIPWPAPQGASKFPKYLYPPPDWRPRFVDPELWRALYHPDAQLSDAEWLVVWAYFGPGRGHLRLTAYALEIQSVSKARHPSSRSSAIDEVLARPHVVAACKYVREVLSLSCLTDHDLRSFWTSVVNNESAELQQRMSASAHLARSMGLFKDFRTIEHTIQVDLAAITNEELARIVAGGDDDHAVQGKIVDAQISTTVAPALPGKGDGKKVAVNETDERHLKALRRAVGRGLLTQMPDPSSTVGGS